MAKLCTWNIRFGGQVRCEKIVEALQSHNPDVIVLTEAMDGEAGRSIEGLVRKAGWERFVLSGPLGPKALGVAIAWRDSFRPNAAVSPAFADDRNLLEVGFGDFHLIGAYLPWNDDGGRKVQCWDRLLSRTSAMRDQRCIVMGDFNTGRDEADGSGEALLLAAYMRKLEDGGFIETWRRDNPVGREYSWRSDKGGNGQRLDHIFLSPSLCGLQRTVKYDHAVRENRISDHSIMTIELAL